MSTTKTSALASGVEPTMSVPGGSWHGLTDSLQDFAGIQEVTLAYVQRRFERELDAIAHAMSCRDATELLDLQVHYASAVLADTFALGLRLAALVNGSARRRYRRAAARRHARAGTG